MSRGEVAMRLLRLLRPLAPLMTVSATARVVNQGLGVAIPAVAAGLVVGFTSRSDIEGFLLLLVVMALVKGTFRYLEQFTGHAVAFRLLAELRVETFRKVTPLAPGGLDDERSGDLVARVVGDIDRVEPFYAHTIAPMASGVMVPVLTAIGMAIWVDPVLAAVFIPFPLLMVFAVPWIKARRAAELSTVARDQAGETAAVFTDAVQGAREIAVFRATDAVADRIDGHSQRGSTTRRALSRISAARSGLGDLLAGAVVIAVATIAVARFEAGLIELSGLAAAVVVAWVGTTPARALEDIVPDLEEALAAASRLFELSDRQPPVRPPERPADGPGGGSVIFDNVSVRFDGPSPAALSDVSVEIGEGSYTAVVGPSGSGKSTLVELLARFRDPGEGRVAIGRIDIRDIDLTRLRREVMLVSQRPEIFYGSIADNLRLANPGATDGELWGALDRADLGSWARSLPHGLETATGELGETLSGGQRQRLALARAFLRDPKILILDEATSELDIGTERRVLDEVSLERGRRTLIVVAHRLESVQDADAILVLDRGRLVERGTHDQLVALEGVYSGLWRRHLDVMEPA